MMSKIYDALQIALGEKLTNSKAQPNTESKQETIDLSSVTIPSSSSPLVPIKNERAVPRFHTESELRGRHKTLPHFFRIQTKMSFNLSGHEREKGLQPLFGNLLYFPLNTAKSLSFWLRRILGNPHYQAFGIDATLPLDLLIKEKKPIEEVLSRIEHSNLFLATLSSTIESALSVRTFYNPLDLWKMVREQFSLILIDSSPVNVTEDSLMLCETVDGVVLVVETEKTRSAVVKKVRNQILMREGNLLGIVFTKRKMYISEMLYKLL